MSNCEIIELRSLDIEPYQVTEVLRCLLHTITFNRALGAVTPHDVHSELFDLTWVTCGDPEVDARIESKVATVQSWVDKNPGKHIQVRLGFFEKRQQHGWSFYSKSQRLFWEQWIIPLNLVQVEHSTTIEPEAVYRAKQKQILQTQIESCLTQIITAVNDKRDHIPPVVSEKALTFPFEVTVDEPTSETSSIFGVDIVKRMLSSTHPPSVLH
jgi:autophagy-related protein 101